ncbi:type VII secretion protein EccE [Amycolatopsis jiangsuensis]|uniref:Type VII secretion system protein EccE domain-containing protein n=1 Tax=Amycolatopsis jiangsuensis TaxID=1181879 RepID=A0A840J3S0_9PSEU|nr:type VII secretion protein EccE [Amycolatopsis jiangsuensis]MBB4688369.1 hypothetical protein [Amycolatopsis jiangsuensis]
MAQSKPVPSAVRIELPQVVCWQLSVVAVLATLGRPWPVLTAAAAGAAVLLALTAVRVHGSWLYELAGLGSRFLVRHRRHELPDSAAKARTLIRLLLPGSEFRPLETAQGSTAAISHAHGLTALLVPGKPVDPRTFPMPAELLPPSNDDDPEFAVQVAFHAGTRPGSPVRTWLAAGAVRSADVPGDAELELALRNALRRIRRALARAGVPADPPPPDTVSAALTALAHVTGGRNELREDWRFWRTGPVSQACFTLDGWGTPADPVAAGLTAGLLAPITGITGVAVSLTLAARTGGDRSAILRLAATTEAAVDAAADRLARFLVPAGVRLSRLDGGHFPAVAASLPIGGFSR